MTGRNAPLADQPLKLPVSNPPFTTPPCDAVVTVRLTFTEWVALGLVPVTVIVYVPVAVPAPTLTVSVEEPPVVTDVGLSDTVVPARWPLALRLML